MYLGAHDALLSKHMFYIVMLSHFGGTVLFLHLEKSDSSEHKEFISLFFLSTENNTKVLKISKDLFPELVQNDFLRAHHG